MNVICRSVLCVQRKTARWLCPQMTQSLRIDQTFPHKNRCITENEDSESSQCSHTVKGISKAPWNEYQILPTSLKGSYRQLGFTAVCDRVHRFSWPLQHKIHNSTNFFQLCSVCTRDSTWHTRWSSIILQESTHPFCSTYPLWGHGGSRQNKLAQTPFSIAASCSSFRGILRPDEISVWPYSCWMDPNYLNRKVSSRHPDQEGTAVLFWTGSPV